MRKEWSQDLWYLVPKRKENVFLTHLISNNTGSGCHDTSIMIRIGLHSNLDGIKWLADIGAKNGTDSGREQISGNGTGISDCFRHCWIEVEACEKKRVA